MQAFYYAASSDGLINNKISSICADSVSTNTPPHKRCSVCMLLGDVLGSSIKTLDFKNPNFNMLCNSFKDNHQDASKRVYGSTSHLFPFNTMLAKA